MTARNTIALRLVAALVVCAAIAGVQAAPGAAGASNGGQALYMNNCAECHGAGGEGNPPEFPSLLKVGARLTDSQVRQQVQKGSDRMPGFAGTLSDEEVGAVIAYIKGGLKGDPKDDAAPARGKTP